MSTITLSGLSPDDPLGFRAAVGLLHLCERLYPGDCRLSWQPMRAALHTEHLHDEAQLVRALDEDHRQNAMPSWLTWDNDLRVPAGQYCEQLADADRTSLEAFAALAHEYVTDKNGKLRPTRWRMHGVKERTGWLAIIRQVARAMTAEKWHEALFGPWRYEDTVSPMGWDPSVVQRHAEQARRTGVTRPLATAGAVWLAVLSLPLFPVFVRRTRRRRLATTGIVDNAFYWPIWSQPATLDTVRFLLQLDYSALSAEKRQALGVKQLWRSRLVPVGNRQALEAGELIG